MCFVIDAAAKRCSKSGCSSNKYKQGADKDLSSSIAASKISGWNSELASSDLAKAFGNRSLFFAQNTTTEATSKLCENSSRDSLSRPWVSKRRSVSRTELLVSSSVPGSGNVRLL